MDSGVWWWVAYTDDKRPKGERALGAVIVRHPGGFAQVERYIADVLHLIVPGVSMGGMMPADYGEPPLGYANRLLSPDEAKALADKWGGGVATSDDIAKAFADDSAQLGDPLFRGPR